METTKFPKRYRNFIVKNVPTALENKAKSITKYKKDDVIVYHVSLFNSSTLQCIRKLAGDDAEPAGDMKDYTHIEDLLYGIEKVQKEVTRYKQEHEKKLQRGKLLYAVLEKEAAHFKLPPMDQQCVKLYMNYLRTAGEGTELHPWQKRLEQEIEATDRKVIWVYGQNGGEGKTWFQKYIERTYGERRVYVGVLSSKAENIAAAMKHEFLAFKDIFLFNCVRSDSPENAYSILEGIKDGCYFSGKYVSAKLHFKTPNTVIVFANSIPKYERLSYDRWIVYRISNNMLHRER